MPNSFTRSSGPRNEKGKPFSCAISWTVSTFVSKDHVFTASAAEDVTTLEPLTPFYVAEDYHQDFAKKNPKQGYVQRFALPKLDKVMTQFKDQVKKPEPQK